MTATLRRTLLGLLALVMMAAALVGFASPAEAASKFKVYLSGSHTYPSVNGYNAIGIVRGSGAAGDVLGVQFWYRYWGRAALPKAKVTLQRQVGKKWIKVATARKSARYEYSASLPGYSVAAGVTSETVRYRLKSARSGKVKNTSYSKVYTVVYENRDAYTGLARSIADAIAPWCPTTAVHVVDTLTGARAGEFASDVGISVVSAVASYSAENLRTIALHECAHQRQFTNFGSSPAGDALARAEAAKYFVDDNGDTPGFDPYEHAADCAAKALNPDGYLGYGGVCNASELAHGLSLMQGGKY